MSDGVSPSRWSTVRVCLVLAAVCLLHLGLSFGWLIREGVFTLPPQWGQAANLTKGLLAYGVWEHDGLQSGLHALLREYPFDAPMLSGTSMLLYRFFGTSRPVAQLTNLVYLWPLCCAVFLLAATGARSQQAGWLAAWICLTATGTITYSRDYLAEPVLTAWLALAIWCYVRSDRCRLLGWALGAGVCVGGTLLSRKTGAAYLMGPLLVAGWQVFSDARPGRQRRVAHALTVLVVAGVLASTWYVAQSQNLFHYLIFYGFGEGRESYWGSILPPWLERCKVMLINLATYAVGWGYAVLGLGVLLWWIVWTFSRRGRQDHGTKAGVAGLCVAWFVGSVVLFSLLQVVATQYFIPMIPPVAVLIGWCVTRIPGRWARAVAFVALGVIGSMNYLLTQTVVTWLPPEAWVGSLRLYSQFDPEFHQQRRMAGTLEQPATDWRQTELVAMIGGSGDQGCRHVFMAPDHAFLNYNTLRYALVAHGIADVVSESRRKPDDHQLGEAIDNADCVVAKTGVVSSSLETFSIEWERIMRYLRGRHPAWDTAGRWSLPDGTDVVLFQRQRASGEVPDSTTPDRIGTS